MAWSWKLKVSFVIAMMNVILGFANIFMTFLFISNNDEDSEKCKVTQHFTINFWLLADMLTTLVCWILFFAIYLPHHTRVSRIIVLALLFLSIVSEAGLALWGAVVSRLYCQEIFYNPKINSVIAIGILQTIFAIPLFVIGILYSATRIRINYEDTANDALI